MTDAGSSPVTLEFIGRQLERVLDEQAAMRGRNDTLTAAVLRLDSRVETIDNRISSLNQLMRDLLIELHAIHVELAGFDRRLHRLEEARP
jgi:hypothetical protein